MSAVSFVKGYAEAILAASGVAALLKSVWNGYVYDKLIRRIILAEKAHEKTQEIDTKLDAIADRQEKQTDAMVALAKAANDPDEEIDVDALLDDTDRENDREFLADD